MIDQKFQVCYVSWEAPTLSSKATLLFCVSAINEWEFLLHVSGCALSVFGVLCRNLSWFSLLTDKRWLKYIFYIIFCHSLYSWVSYLLRPLTHFFLNWIVLLFLNFIHSLCITHTNLLSDIYFANIFFLFCGLSFYSLNNLFHWAENFNEPRKSVISFTEHVIIVSKTFSQPSEFPDSTL